MEDFKPVPNTWQFKPKEKPLGEELEIVARPSVRKRLQVEPQVWKSLQTKKAIRAVNAGLDYGKDPYKRGTLGIAVLKGLGHYAQEINNTQVNLFQAVPDSLSAEFMDVGALEVSDMHADVHADHVIDTEDFA